MCQLYSTYRSSLVLVHRSTFCLKPTFPWIIAKNLTLLQHYFNLAFVVSKIRQFLQYGLFQNEEFLVQSGLQNVEKCLLAEFFSSKVPATVPFIGE